MPEGGTTVPFSNVFHRFVFRQTDMLIAGRIHHYRIRRLRRLYAFQGAAADPVMHIVDPATGAILAENDDFGGMLESEIIFTPTTSGPARIIIRPSSTKTPGVCDLEKGLDGAAPVPITTNLTFNGVTAFAAWNAGDIFRTFNSTGDPILFIRTASNTMLFDDDSGPGLDSLLVAPTADVGRVILGSFSTLSEGVASLTLDAPAGEITLAFNLSERPDETRPREREEPISPEMERYIATLRESKRELEDLEPEERDQKVRELQKELLTDEERRPLVLPGPQASADYVRLQNVYLEQYAQLDRELEGLDYEERAARVSELKTKILGPM
jgi:hypothetical protein